MKCSMTAKAAIMCSDISRPIYYSVCVLTDTLTGIVVPETTCCLRVERGVPLASVIYPALPQTITTSTGAYVIHSQLRFWCGSVRHS
jgi:hypothetical protein